MIKDALSAGETIEFVTHSMGAAFAEGMIDDLMEDNDLKGRISEIVHFSPAQPSDITIAEKSKNIERTQLDMQGDFTLEMLHGGDGDDGIIEGVGLRGIVRTSIKEMHPKLYEASVKKGKEPDWDFHYDTKTFKESFDYVRDLIKYTGSIGVGNDVLHTFNVFNSVTPFGTSFKSLNIKGNELNGSGISGSTPGSEKYTGDPKKCEVGGW